MPKYRVTVNFAQFEIVAADEDEAQESALGEIDDIDVEEIKEDDDDDELEEEEEP
jgi:hypothetical protein